MFRSRINCITANSLKTFKSISWTEDPQITGPAEHRNTRMYNHTSQEGFSCSWSHRSRCPDPYHVAGVLKYILDGRSVDHRPSRAQKYEDVQSYIPRAVQDCTWPKSCGWCTGIWIYVIKWDLSGCLFVCLFAVRLIARSVTQTIDYRVNWFDNIR
jgi:hypothetical protein